MHPGALIDIPSKEGARVVAVIAAQGKKLRVIDEHGREQTLSPDRSWLLLGDGAPVSDRLQASELARKAGAEISALQAELDLEVVWDLLVDDGGRFELAELAELALGEEEILHQAAVRRAIEEDRLLFRAKKDSFEPSARKLVDEVRRQRAAEAERAARREAELQTLRDALADDEELGADDSPELVGLLVGLAVNGPEYARLHAALEVLDALGTPGGREPHLKAFDLLVRLGRFHPDENLPLLKAEVPTQFRAELHAEAAELAQRTPWDAPERVDLTQRTTIAIDDPETTEVDDALSAQRGPGDGWTVWVHIADPSAFIADSPALMNEAGRRAATLYLPEGKLTMIPPELSEGPMSLSEGAERAALTLEAQVSSDGEILASRFLVSRVRVDRQLSYEEADRLLEEAGPLGDLLHHLADAAFALESVRRASGALTLNGAEVKIRCSPDGRITIRPIDTLSPSRALVAEMMILMGTSAAQLFMRQGIPASFRVQPSPDEEIHLPEGPLDPATFYATVKRLHRAEVSRIPGRHAGLGVEPYVQISSPIRRYADLLLQQQLKAFLAGGEPHYDEEELLNALGRAELTVDTLSSIERERRRYWTLRYLKERKGTDLEAVLLDERNSGHYLAELTSVCMRVPVDAPAGLAPGTRVAARVGSADPRRDRVSLRFRSVIEDEA